MYSDGSYAEEDNSSLMNELINNSSELIYNQQGDGNYIVESEKKSKGNLSISIDIKNQYFFKE